MNASPWTGQLMEKYGVQMNEIQPAPSFQYTAKELANNPEALDHVVRIVADRGNNRLLQSAASLMTKQLGHMLCSILYSFSLHDHIHPLDKQPIRWVAAESKAFSLLLPPPRALESAEERRAARETLVNQLYGQHAAPIIQALHERFKLKTSLLWENLFIYIEAFYKQAKQQTEDTTRLALIEEDHHFITKHSSPELYGDASLQPFHLKSKVIEHPLHPGETFRVRGSCCLRFCLPDGKRCTTCPGLKPDARAARLLETTK